MSEKNFTYWGVYNTEQTFEYSRWFTDTDGVLVAFISQDAANLQKEIISAQWGIAPDLLEVRAIQ